MRSRLLARSDAALVRAGGCAHAMATVSGTPSPVTWKQYSTAVSSSTDSRSAKKRRCGESSNIST
eukprot:172512-Rhodomonas_salina.2